LHQSGRSVELVKRWRTPVVLLATLALALEVPSFLGAEAMESSGHTPAAVAPTITYEPVVTYQNIVSEVVGEPDALDESFIDCFTTPCVALSFDDGPGPYTPQILEILKEFDARATFYVVGQQIASWPRMLPLIAEAGHDIGNHTMSHPKLSELTVAEQIAQINGLDEMVVQRVGVMPTTIRPPFGDMPEAPLPDALNRPVVLWSVDSFDWKKRKSDAIVDEVLSDIGAGDIVLMHELYQRSVDALPEILTELNNRGLTVVSVADLLGPSLFVSGEVTHVPFTCQPVGPELALPTWCEDNPDWVRVIN
jgi:peptidoglycan/xylan/chitin deacetylase (PgdA/CDA1 family)